MSAPVRSQGSTAHGAFLRDLAVGRSGAVGGQLALGCRGLRGGAGPGEVPSGRRRVGPDRHPSQVEANSPVCAVDAAGRAVVVYVVNGTAYAVRRPAGRWTAPEVIGRHVEPPQLAVGDAGDVVVVWSALLLDLGVFRPQAVTRPVGGPWSAPVTLDSAGPTEPVVGTGPGGTSTAAWARPDGSVVASRHTRTGTWSAPRVVAPPGDRVVPQSPYLQVSVGRSGAVLLSWTRQRGDASTVGAAYRPPGTPGSRRTGSRPRRCGPRRRGASSAAGTARCWSGAAGLPRVSGTCSCAACTREPGPAAAAQSRIGWGTTSTGHALDRRTVRAVVPSRGSGQPCRPWWPCRPITRTSLASENSWSATIGRS